MSWPPVQTFPRVLLSSHRSTAVGPSSYATGLQPQSRLSSTFPTTPSETSDVYLSRHPQERRKFAEGMASRSMSPERLKTAVMPAISHPSPPGPSISKESKSGIQLESKKDVHILPQIPKEERGISKEDKQRKIRQIYPSFEYLTEKSKLLPDFSYQYDDQLPDKKDLKRPKPTYNMTVNLPSPPTDKGIPEIAKILHTNKRFRRFMFAFAPPPFKYIEGQITVRGYVSQRSFDLLTSKTDIKEISELTKEAKKSAYADNQVYTPYIYNVYDLYYAMHTVILSFDEIKNVPVSFRKTYIMFKETHDNDDPYNDAITQVMIGVIFLNTPPEILKILFDVDIDEMRGAIAGHPFVFENIIQEHDTADKARPKEIPHLGFFEVLNYNIPTKKQKHCITAFAQNCLPMRVAKKIESKPQYDPEELHDILKSNDIKHIIYIRDEKVYQHVPKDRKKILHICITNGHIYTVKPLPAKPEKTIYVKNLNDTIREYVDKDYTFIRKDDKIRILDTEYIQQDDKIGELIYNYIKPGITERRKIHDDFKELSQIRALSYTDVNYTDINILNSTVIDKRKAYPSVMTTKSIITDIEDTPTYNMNEILPGFYYIELSLEKLTPTEKLILLRLESFPKDTTKLYVAHDKLKLLAPEKYKILHCYKATNITTDWHKIDIGDQNDPQIDEKITHEQLRNCKILKLGSGMLEGTQSHKYTYHYNITNSMKLREGHQITREDGITEIMQSMTREKINVGVIAKLHIYELSHINLYLAGKAVYDKYELLPYRIYTDSLAYDYIIPKSFIDEYIKGFRIENITEKKREAHQYFTKPQPIDAITSIKQINSIEEYITQGYKGNLLIHGPAGSGKTYSIKKFMDEHKKKYIYTATTKALAEHNKADTTQHFIRHLSLEEIEHKISPDTYIIVDECYLLKKHSITQINTIFHRHNVIFLGDECQLSLEQDITANDIPHKYIYNQKLTFPECRYNDKMTVKFINVLRQVEEFDAELIATIKTHFKTITYIEATEKAQQQSAIIMGWRHKYTDEIDGWRKLAQTVHSSQGQTIEHDIIITDWEETSPRLFYTAMTRVRTMKNVYLCEKPPVKDKERS